METSRELNNEIQKIVRQKGKLAFGKLDIQATFESDRALIAKEKKEDGVNTINVSLNKSHMFHFSTDSAVLGNDNWLRRKENTVYHSHMAVTAAICEYLWQNPGYFDPRQYLSPAWQSVNDMVSNKIQNVFGCEGKA